MCIFIHTYTHTHTPTHTHTHTSIHSPVCALVWLFRICAIAYSYMDHGSSIYDILPLRHDSYTYVGICRYMIYTYIYLYIHRVWYIPTYTYMYIGIHDSYTYVPIYDIGEWRRSYRAHLRYVTHMNESCHKYDWVMSHIWIHHFTRVDESCHTCELFMTHHTHMNYGGGEATVWIWVMSHMFTCE